MTITYISAGSNFLNAAFSFIGDRELKHNTWDLYPQDVGDGKVTIGAGLNLTSGKDVCSERRVGMHHLPTRAIK